MSNEFAYLLVIKHGEVYAPEYLGRKDILVAGRKIASIADEINFPPEIPVLEAEGMWVVPGFIDNHVHMVGGGGEGSFKTRTPEIVLSQIVRAGVTTAIGCLGTDSLTRRLSNLLAKARGLQEEGITTFIYTGSYHVPVHTLTGSVQTDIVYIDKIIGVGEIAISDHRSSQPAYNDVLKIVSDAYVAGLLSGKAGLVMFHVGKGTWQIRLLEDILAGTEIPPQQLLPTHMDRTPELLETAVEYTHLGGFVDLTTSTPSELPNGKNGNTADAFLYLLEHQVEVSQILFSSDAQGSLPVFDERGNLLRLGVGQIQTLFQTVQELVLRHGLQLETALEPVTANPAALFRLAGKGHLRVGADADVLIIRPDDFLLDTVLAKGQIMMQKGELRVKGTFEE